MLEAAHDGGGQQHERLAVGLGLQGRWPIAISLTSNLSSRHHRLEETVLPA